MRKYKKALIALSIIFVVTLSGYLFRKTLSREIASAVIHHVTKNILGQPISYRKIEYEKGKIQLYCVSHFESEDAKFLLTIPRVEITFHFDLLHLVLHSKIDCIQPHLSIKKNKGKLQLPWKTTSSQYVQTSVFIQEGVLELQEDNYKEKIYLSFDRGEFFNLGSLFVSFFSNNKKEAHAKIDVHPREGGFTLNAQFFELNAKKVHRIFTFFDPEKYTFFGEISGLINGLSTIRIQNSVEHFFANLKISDFSLPLAHLQAKGEKAHLELEYPVEGRKEAFLFKTFLPNSFLEKVRLRLSLQETKVFSAEEFEGWQLANIQGNFSFNPGVGPKWELTGQALSKECVLPFSLDGKGFFYSSFSNWVESHLLFTGPIQSRFSFKAHELQEELCLDVICDQTTPHHVEILQDLFGSMYKPLQELVVYQGKWDASFNLLFEKKKLQKIDLEKISAENVELQYGSFLPKANWEHLKGSLRVDLLQDDIASGFSSFLDLQGAELVLALPGQKEWGISNLHAEIATHEGIFDPSFIHCFFNHIKTECDLFGSISAFESMSSLSGRLDDLATFFLDSTEDNLLFNQHFSSKVLFRRDQEGLVFSGTVQIEEENLSFGLSWTDPFKPLESVSSGWLRGEKIHLDKSAAVFPDWEGQISGYADFEVALEKELLCIHAKAMSFILKFPDFIFTAPQIGDCQSPLFEPGEHAYFTYNRKEDEWTATSPLKNVNFYIPKFDLTFKNTDGCVNFKNHILDVQIDESKGEGLTFSGKTYIDLSDKDAVRLDIVTDTIVGELSSAKRFAEHFDLDLFSNRDLRGNFLSERGFFFTKVFSDEDFPAYWTLQACLDNVVFPLTDYAKVQKGQLQIDWDSGDDLLQLIDAQGEILTKNGSYDLSIPMICLRNHQWEFDFRIEKPMWNILRCKGSVKDENDLLHWQFDPEFTHFFGMKISTGSFAIKEKEIVSLRLEADLEMDRLLDQLQFLSELQFPIFSIKEQKMEGLIHCDVVMEEKGEPVISLHGEQVTLFSQKIEHFDFFAKKENKNWQVDRLHVDEMEVSFSFYEEGDRWKIPQFFLQYGKTLQCEIECSFRKKGMEFEGNVKNVQINLANSSNIVPEFSEGFLEGQGWFSLHLPQPDQKLFFETDLDLKSKNISFRGTSLENKGSIHLSYSTKKGFMLSGLDLHFPTNDPHLSRINCKIGYMQYCIETGSWIFRDAHVFLPSDFFVFLQGRVDKELQRNFGLLNDALTFDADINFKGDIECASDFSKFELFINEGHFPIKGETRHVKNLFFSFSPKDCSLEMLYKHRGYFYKIAVETAFLPSLRGKIAFYEPKITLPSDVEPLTIEWIWKEGFNIETIQGHFCGLDAYFHREFSPTSNSLSGGVKIDFSQVAKLCPSDFEELFVDQLNMGKGYELKGILRYSDKLSFIGSFSGKQCELGGYLFKTLYSQIDFQLGHVQISDLKISDSAGIVKIDSILCDETAEGDMLYIPKIKVSEFRPSLLQKIGFELGELTPLVIREMEITDLKGNLDDKATFTGKGHMNFINSFKREHTVFDIPANFFGRIIGLDFELLIPVCGKLEYEIRDRKFILKDLKDAFSENERSKFFLVQKEGREPYVDFDGNMQINIEMKQYVLFKITELFIINITGKLKDPDINLQKKSRFFSS